MSRNGCNISQKKEQLINDLQALISCVQLSASKKPDAAPSTGTGSRKKCTPCPLDGNRNRNRDNQNSDDSWKKDRYKSRELKSGVLITGCLCTFHNGLQHDCPRSDCRGRPPCLVKPWPDCLPSGGTGLKGYAPKESKYPPLPPRDCGIKGSKGAPKESHQCHRAGMDCEKCEPVLMCPPGGGLGPDDMKMNIIGQLTTCPKEDRSRLADEPKKIGCPPRREPRGDGIQPPACRPANPQPVQETVPTMKGGNGDCIQPCDPPTHVLKQPAYPPAPEVPRCPKPRVVHHPHGKILPDYTQLRAGQRDYVCLCLHNNGLQDECRLRKCGIPECLMRPPDCLPAGGKGGRRRNADDNGRTGDGTGTGACAGAAGGLTFPGGFTCPEGYQAYICFSPCPPMGACQQL